MSAHVLHRRSPSGAEIRIHYEVTGSGPPVVLGHSFLCSGEMWRNQVGPLSAGHTVVNIDTRGHGRSGPIREPFTVYDVVDDAVAVLDQEAIESAVWCGLSLGGMTALRAALTHPDRVAALVLMDTHAGADRARERLKYRAMIAIAGLVGIEPLLGRATKLMFGPRTRRESPDLVSEWRGRFAANDVPSVRMALRCLVARDDVSGLLGRIDVPTLVMVGADDRPQPPSRSKAIAAGIPGSQFVEVPGAGHLSALEQPGPVTGTILGFLDGLPGRD